MAASRWVVLVAALAACRRNNETRPAPVATVEAGSAAGSVQPAPDNAEARRRLEALPLFSDDELATLRDSLLQRLDANAQRTCSAPKVTGSTRPGPGRDALVQLFEGTGDMASCIGRLATLPKGAALRAAVETRDKVIVDLDRACGKRIAAKVMEAAAHADGCSPYQTGVRVEPPLDNVILVAKVLEFHTGELVATGRRADAVQIAVGALRVFQDLMRGHVSHLGVGSVAAAASQSTATSLERMLDTGKLRLAEYVALSAKLDALIAAMPSWADLMAGERDQMEIYFGAPLMPKDWTPPGGWVEHLRGLADRSAPDLKSSRRPRDAAALLLAASADYTTEVFARCSPTASYFACHKAVSAANEKTADFDEPAYLDELEELQKAAAARPTDVDALREDVRTLEIRRLRRSVRAKKADVAKFATLLARLAELRILVEARRNGECPTASDLLVSPYGPLSAPAGLGGGVLVFKPTADATEVRPPDWTESSVAWTLRCAPW